MGQWRPSGLAIFLIEMPVHKWDLLDLKGRKDVEMQ